MDGRPVPNHGPASIIIPMGAGGPAFMTFRNFTVITRYNNSENYVIGIGHLSDRLVGGPPIRGAFPPDRQGMTIADRQELQRRLTAALKILQNGDTTPGNMTGSWAGAMGHTQFIPTSYLAYAVDFRGDGRRDIWSDDPTDALASTAAYLSRSGWQRGRLWGLEVQLPAGFAGPVGRNSTRSVADWQASGVRSATGGNLPDHGPGSILIPQGANGPAFLIFRNFSVILRYNNAENYAFGVGHLSDRLNGGGPIRAAFPPDAAGMSKLDRQDLQRRLTAAGHEAGPPDGVIGTKTREAISAFQQARGLAVTGEPSQQLLALLR
jgi:membrane-bound lytic murein transglycosylase B